MRRVTEERHSAELPLWLHPVWRDELPWLVQGTTGAGDGEPFDLGLFGSRPVGEIVGRWRTLREALSMPCVVHARQIHGVEVARHERPMPQGLVVAEGLDGHATDQPGLLLSVSVADCVPVFLADARTRTVAAAHAGWRGTAGGILERTIGGMTEAWGSRPDDIHVHLGPSICGQCYEVGPEVHAAVHPDRDPPAAAEPIDLRAALAGRAEAAGVRESRVSVSTHCTRCGPGEFFSHRGGSAARQMGVIGISR